MDALDWRTAQLPFIYYNKIDWGAQPARGGSELSLPVPYAVIHHSYIPGACFNFEECQQSMQLGFPFYTREDWMAAPSTDNRPLKTPVPYVVIHHTYIPAACNTTVQCKADMRAMQQYHQSLGWGDIGYQITNTSSRRQRADQEKSILAESSENEVVTYDFPYTSRSEWDARPATEVLPLPTPVPYVKYPVRPAQERSKMKLLLVVLLIAMVVGVIVAVPAVMLSKKSILAESSENEVVTYDFPYTSRSEWDARPATEVLPLPTPVPYVVIHHSATPAACYNKQETSIWMAGIGGILDTDSVPPAEQLKTVKALIAAGVELGYIKPDYKLVGHRQVRETECPGQAFFDVVKTWDHWSPFPASHEDLVNVPEISDDYKDKYLKKSVL
ncbi:hypothetical protein MSG28_005786 [Choristoneura fumiferana]|uniref:Uncharacterized protein n=1 Tax=Choristoneura fumiferana TaxID=7141 RepID=A0ACC0L1E5_CHOFU|nr:hypothetical protein MSG28_005786 [Choristoneura fumiferana]